MGGRGGGKNACIQTGGLAELMGTRRGAFLRGNNLHNGKVVGVGAESSPLVGTVSEVEGESSYQTEGQYQGALRGRCVLLICSFASCHLQNNLPTISPAANMYLVCLLLKRLWQNCSVFIPLMKLTIFSSQLAMIKKKKEKEKDKKKAN